MRKLTSALLVLLFASMQNLVADGHEGKLTVKISPSAEGQGKIYFGGDQYRKLANPQPSGKAKVNFSADYNGIGGVQVDLNGALTKDNTTFGFGDNAFAYIHLLQAFGMDPKVFDVYLKSGRFKSGYGRGGELPRENQINMQLDLKILNMLTVRTGVALRPFEQAGKLNRDLAFGLGFNKTFADAHNIDFKAGYSVDLTNNQGNDMNGASKAGNPEPGAKKLEKGKLVAIKDVEKPTKGSDFDQLGFEVAYRGTFGTIQIAPFFGLTVHGLIAKPRYSLVSPKLAWSAGLQFKLHDKDKNLILGAKLGFDGEMRENNNYKTASTDEEAENTDNKAFKGFDFALETHALKVLMGKQYLSFEAKLRFDFDDPKQGKDGKDMKREAFFSSFELKAKQRLLAVSDASVNMILNFGLKNIAPYYLEDTGYVSSPSSETAQHAALESYIEIGLDASFTAKVERMVN